MHLYLFRFNQPITGEPVAVTTYAALMFAGAVVAVLASVALARRRGLPAFDVFAGGAIGFGAGYVGARLLFLALDGGQVFRLYGWKGLLAAGGLVWYGGLAAGALAFVAYARAYRLPLLPALDVMAPGVALGHAFGRLGCFTAGCCYGRPAPHLPWAVRFPAESLAPAGVLLHPVQLYEAAGLVLLSIVLALVVWRERRPGVALFGYLVGYAVLRFVTETFRGDDRGGTIGPFSPSQAIALGVIFLAVIAALIARTRRRLPAGEVSPGAH